MGIHSVENRGGLKLRVDHMHNMMGLGRERKERRGAAAAATICGPRSLASGLAAGGDEERGSVSSTDRLSL